MPYINEGQAEAAWQSIQVQVKLSTDDAHKVTAMTHVVLAQLSECEEV